MSLTPLPHAECVAEDFEKLWNIVESEGLQPIFTKEGKNPLQPHELENIRSVVQRICSPHGHHHDEVSKCSQRRVYERVMWYTVQFYCNRLLPRLNAHGKTVALLEKVHDEWHHCKYTVSKIIGNCFSVLENTFIRRSLGFQGMKEMIRERFESCIYQGLSHVLHEVGFSSFTKYGDIKDQACLDQIRGLIGSLGKHKSGFCRMEWDDPVITFLVPGMSTVIDGWAHCSAQSLLHYAHQKIVTYRSICILEDSKDLIVKRFCDDLQVTRENVLFGNGAYEFTRLIEEGRNQDWERLFRCFGKDRDFMNKVSNFLEDYLRKIDFRSPQSENSEPSKDEEAFKRMMALWRKFDDIIQCTSVEGIGRELTVVQTIRSYFVNLIRRPPGSFNLEARIADYCHSLLSKSDEVMHVLLVSKMEALQHVISFASLLHEPNAFFEVYRIWLAKRLLEGTSESYQMELMVVHDLFNLFPSETFSLSLILKDFSTWHRYQYDIAAWDWRNSKPDAHGSIIAEPKILRAFHWPNLPDAKLNLPKELQGVEDAYIDFFSAEHPSMQISVHSCAGKAVVSASLWGGNSYKLSLTTGQLCVLSLFEERDEISVKNVMDELLSSADGSCLSNDFEESEETLIAVLKSMMSEYKVLQKQPDTLEFKGDHKLILNKAFEPQEALTKLSPPGLFLNSGGEGTFVDVVEPLREQYIQAAVMKIMKDQREMSKEELVELVIDNLGMFEVDPNMVETGLQELCRKEYMELDETMVKYIP